MAASAGSAGAHVVDQHLSLHDAGDGDNCVWAFCLCHVVEAIAGILVHLIRCSRSRLHIVSPQPHPKKKKKKKKKYIYIYIYMYMYIYIYMHMCVCVPLVLFSHGFVVV